MRSVAVNADGTVMVIGQPAHDGEVDGFVDGGRVAVYDLIGGTTWVQRGTAILGEINQSENNGWDVAISDDGNTIIAGSTQYDGPASGNGQEGRARVFQWDGSDWVQRGSDIHGLDEFDTTGVNVDMSGDGSIIVVASNEAAELSGGYVRVFEWGGSDWVQLGQTITGTACSGSSGLCDRAGEGVALSSDGLTLAVGYRGFDNGVRTDTGLSRVYVYQGSAWIQNGRDISAIISNRQLGKSIVLSNDGATLGITGRGGVGIYEFGTDWTQKGSSIIFASTDDLAISMDASGNSFVVGAPDETIGDAGT